MKNSTISFDEHYGFSELYQNSAFIIGIDNGISELLGQISVTNVVTLVFCALSSLVQI